MKFFNKLWEIIYPSNLKCIFCSEELDGTTSNLTCDSCYKTLPFITKYCPCCGLGMSDDNDKVCFNCKTINYEFDKARAVFEYAGEVLNVIHKLKYAGLTDLAKPLAGFMIDLFVTLNFNVDIICAVPLHENKLKERKFNQSELLARAVADKFNIPYLELCVKTKENSSQTQLDFKARRENVKDVYTFNKEYTKVITDKTVLIIDDIFTTGATANEVAKVLKKAGAKVVNVLTLAHTAPPGSTPAS